jgi:predicted dehydrogenase
MSASRESRRRFLANTTAVVAGTVLAAQPAASRAVHVAGSDVLRVGLIGCGGRGTGAATQALKADPHVKLVAMGDAFADRLSLSLNSLQKIEAVADKLDVPAERQFVGFDAYRGVIEHSDVVLLAAPPHFRPLHLQAAVEAGKHVFAEKPVAVDGPGVRSVLATCRKAAENNLSVVSGLCLRYSYAFQEMMKRLHDGAIGDIVTLLANDYRGPIWVRPREADWTDMHWQMRNWYYFTWLSGDFIVEQHVHFLDVCAWAMQDKYPVRAMGTGGRQVRSGAEYGHIYDHFSVVYEYDSGARLIGTCRQQAGCANDISAHFLGTKGSAELSQRRVIIRGDQPWESEGRQNDFYQTEHDELFASIRSGKSINNGEYMSYSSLLAILGRTTTYTGQEVTWDHVLNSTEDLSPSRYEWGPMETPSVAMPGITKLI